MTQNDSDKENRLSLKVAAMCLWLSDSERLGQGKIPEKAKILVHARKKEVVAILKGINP